MSEQPKGGYKKVAVVCCAVFLAALLLSVGHNCFSKSVPAKSAPALGQPNFALMAEAWKTIQGVYVDRTALKSETLTHGAIAGMVESLGDTGHSAFLTKDMLNQERQYAEGRYEGVGIEMRMEKGSALIVAPLDGSPAQKAGIRPKQIITKVDGKSLIGLDLGEIVKLILGPAGSSVTLSIFDPATDQSRDVVLKRATISIKNVRWRPLPGTAIAHLRIAGFSKGVGRDLQQALQQITSQKMSGIILDLRDDPGGLFQEVIGCTSQFLDRGDVALVKNAAGEIRRVPVLSQQHVTPLPMVMLVNEGTASAAEIMAGACQDAGRAKLVGQKTFGTGTVLQQFNLSDGSALLLAVEEWLTPKGHSIWHKGIKPDSDVALPEGVRPLLPGDQQNLTQEKLLSSKDTQLLAALKLLSGKQQQEVRK
jgi:carboxyl-terminal processing protease